MREPCSKSRAAAIERGEQVGQRLRAVLAVSVYRSRALGVQRACDLKPALHGSAVAAVARSNHDLDVARGTGQVLRDGGGAVGAAVVDDNDAKKMGRSSSGGCARSPPQVASGVVRRDKDDQLHGKPGARTRARGSRATRDS